MRYGATGLAGSGRSREPSMTNATYYRYLRVPMVTLVYSEQDWSRPVVREQVVGLLGDVEAIILPDTGHFLRSGTFTDVSQILLRRAHHVELTE